MRDTSEDWVMMNTCSDLLASSSCREIGGDVGSMVSGVEAGITAALGKVAYR